MQSRYPIDDASGDTGQPDLLSQRQPSQIVRIRLKLQLGETCETNNLTNASQY